MKWIAIILLGCTVPASFAEVLVTQDFEGTTFPPVGWTVVNYQPLVYWSRYSGAHINCALCSTMMMGQSASLNSPNMNLNAGDLVNIFFDSKIIGITQTAALIALYQGTNCIWSDTCDRKKESHNSFTLPALDTSGSYYVRWVFPDVFASPPVSFFVDDVVIGRNMGNSLTSVAPSSLGRIKSAYK